MDRLGMDKALPVETQESGDPSSWEKSERSGVSGAREATADPTPGLKETICEVAARELSKESLSSIARAAFLGEGGREFETVLRDWDSFARSLGVSESQSKLLSGYLYYLRDDLEAAEQALRSEKGTGWGAYCYARTLVGLRRLDEALRVLEDACEQEPDFLPLAYAKIEALCKTGREVAAFGFLRGMEARDAESSEWAFHHGFCLECAGEYRDAIAEYREAVERDDQNADAWFRLGYLLDLHGTTHEEESDEALRAYESCVAIVPVHANAVVNLGLLYEDRERYHDAARCYEAVLRARPDHARAKLYFDDAIAATTMFYDKAQEEEAKRHTQNLNLPLSDFELSIRSRNCLQKMNVDTLGDLAMRTERELLSFKNFGETSLNEIKGLLAEQGLSLSQGGTDHGQSLLGRNPLEATASAEVLDTSIDCLDLSVRSRRCTDRLEVRSVRDLINKTEIELMSAKNFGMASLEEIRSKLAAIGMALRTPEKQNSRGHGRDISR